MCSNCYPFPNFLRKHPGNNFFPVASLPLIFRMNVMLVFFAQNKEAVLNSFYQPNNKGSPIKNINAVIVIREKFRIHPERMKNARELAKENKIFATKYDMQLQVLTGLEAGFYSIIFTIEAENFDEYL